MFLLTKCVVSGREMASDDDVIGFPFFDSQPGEPEFACCENIALRNEFEKWHLKNSVIKKVKEFWIKDFHGAKSFIILAENQNFLIVKSNIEDNFRLFFLNHVFYVWFTESTWKKFKNLITKEKGNITSNIDSFFVETDRTSYKLTLKAKNIRKDSIIVERDEWQDLRNLISSIPE